MRLSHWSEFCCQKDITPALKKSEFEPQMVGVLSSGGCHSRVEKSVFEPQVVGVLLPGGCHTHVEKSEFEPQMVGVLSSGWDVTPV